MGFLSSIFRGRDASVDRTSGSVYSFFMGGSTSGKRVNERTAMQMTAVYSLKQLGVFIISTVWFCQASLAVPNISHQDIQGRFYVAIAASYGKRKI